MDYNVLIVAFNRPKSLERLIESLNNAYYDCNVNLIISIDKGIDEGYYQVLSLVDNLEWKFGGLTIIKHKVNLGLKKHVLFCGDLTTEYKHLCILEDDLIVSRYYMKYYQQVLLKYEKDDSIAGMSLYSHKKNIENELYFSPLKNNSDVYLLQYAMSWGQIWTNTQWNKFREWYNTNDENFSSSILPRHLSRWSEKSWLKYHIKYCIENKKYFVYPYNSLTTNFSDVGTHSMNENNNFQVPMPFGFNSSYNLILGERHELFKYDAFFEIEDILSEVLKIKDLVVDLYGEKKDFGKNRYVLSCQILDYKIVNSFGLSLRPHELNIVYNIKGNYFFLYDLKKIEKNPNKILKFHKSHYYYYKIPFRELLNQMLNYIREKVFKN